MPRYDFPNVINIAWHPTKNIVSFVTSEGELFIHPDFLHTEAASVLAKGLQPAPLNRDPLAELSGNARKLPSHGSKDDHRVQSRRQGTPDSLDDILGPELDGDDDNDFVSDDDGAGYVNVNGFGKRGAEHLDAIDGIENKRRATYHTWAPRLHEPFQPGSTPWRGNRKYLCQWNPFLGLFILTITGLNLTGFVWTVDQGTYNTITVEFYDREYHRDFHFTDPYLYDKACLSKIPSHMESVCQAYQV